MDIEMVDEKPTVNGTIRGTPDENVGQPYLKNGLSDLAEILYVASSPWILNAHKISARSDGKSIRNSNFKVSHELSKCPMDCSVYGRWIDRLKQFILKGQALNRNVLLSTYCIDAKSQNITWGKCPPSTTLLSKIGYEVFTQYMIFSQNLYPGSMKFTTLGNVSLSWPNSEHRFPPWFSFPGTSRGVTELVPKLANGRKWRVRHSQGQKRGQLPSKWLQS